MDRPYIKRFAGKRFRFEVDGSVTDLSRVSDPVPEPVAVAEPAPEAVDEETKPKRRGRPRKKPDAE